MRDAVIVSATRTAVGKAPNGALRTVRPDEMAAAVIGLAVPDLVVEDVGTVAKTLPTFTSLWDGMLAQTPSVPGG